ncbi:FRG domain-containing protein [Bauldia litoralis]|uniref:FRG domain-containing protein n=1 Tax=Bauldia litoralis TaxID=665467 RepID=UPI0032659594
MRGQGRLYDTLSPTLYRGISKQGKRHERLAKVIKEFCSASTLFNDVPAYAREPLLQHYGVKTSWLDLVDNIWVALWFAIHRAYMSGREGQYMHFDARTSAADGEFAYVLLVRTEDSRKEKVRRGITKGSCTEVIDLRIAAPSVFLRPHAQHGLLFRARGTEGGREIDYAHTIAGIIRFPLDAGKAWLGVGAMHDVRSLFPPPFYDSGYGVLLDVKLTERSLGVITHVGA